MSMDKAREEFEQFQKRAALAESQIKELTKRVAKLEQMEGLAGHRGEPSSSGAAVEECQRDLLEKLRQLREVALEDKKVLEAAIAERDEAVKESEKLREANKKLEYRIQILLKSLEDEERKNKNH